MSKLIQFVPADPGEYDVVYGGNVVAGCRWNHASDQMEMWMAAYSSPFVAPVGSGVNVGSHFW